MSLDSKSVLCREARSLTINVLQTRENYNHRGFAVALKPFRPTAILHLVRSWNSLDFSLHS